VSKARATNLSTTGIGVVCFDKPDGAGSNKVVHLDLHLPGSDQPLRVSAVPVWSSGHLEGLKFVDVTDADRLELAEVIDRAIRNGARVV
jgi:hypothetical protein